MAEHPPRDRSESSDLYSATEQQKVPEYGHSDPAKPGRPGQQPGANGYRRDAGSKNGARGPMVDGDTVPKAKYGPKA